MQERLSFRAGQVLRLLLEVRGAPKQGPVALEQLRRTRLVEMVAFARAYSPYYRNLYSKLPDYVDDPAQITGAGSGPQVPHRHSAALTS